MKKCCGCGNDKAPLSYDKILDVYFCCRACLESWLGLG
jgi:hypothetical protein